MEIKINDTTLSVDTKFIKEWDMTMIIVECNKWEGLPPFLTY